jgi:dienelactone hydrolase
MIVRRKTYWMPVVFVLALLVVGGLGTAHGEAAAEATFTATDTADARVDDSPNVQALLDAVSWKPSEFEVRCTSTPGLRYDALVRFDSPMPSGNRWVDEVVMMWYAARGEDGKAIEAPAVLMIHTLQPQMIIAKQLARDFAKRGLHTFVLQLPGYGHRWEGAGRFPAATALVRGRQGLADCLRARDAIAALPNIKPGPIALQGTSLGGFVAATAGGIEPAFDPVVLLISGGDCYGALVNGKFDAMFLRKSLNQIGYRGEALRELVEPVEPLRVAQRLDPKRTWLISARDDVTIPRASSDALAQAIGLDDEHRLWLGTNHYTTMFVLPAVAQHMAGLILGEEPGILEGSGRVGETALEVEPHD